jgi:hypothetical protein
MDIASIERKGATDIIYSLYFSGKGEDSWNRFIESFSAMREQTTGKFIFVDNGSIMKFWPMTIPRGTIYSFASLAVNEGPGQGRNIGIKAGIEVRYGEYFICIDSDVIPKTKNFISKLVSRLGDEVKIVVPLTTYTSQEEQLMSVEEFNQGDTREDVVVPWAPSLCWAMKYSDILELAEIEKDLEPNPGLFDEEYKYFAFEDTDLCYRVTNRWKKKIIVAGDVFAFHYGGATVNSLEGEQQQKYGEWVGKNMKRYSEKWK